MNYFLECNIKHLRSIFPHVYYFNFLVLLIPALAGFPQPEQKYSKRPPERGIRAGTNS